MTETKQPLVLAVTGHRPRKLGSESRKLASKLIAFARMQLTQLKPSRVLTGMALGWDMAVAIACLEMKIPYVACIPFDGQHIRWDLEHQVAYLKLCNGAEEKIIVSDGGYEPWKMKRRNVFMVDSATELLSLWDGTDGGTAHCVRYAQSLGRTVHHSWPAWKRFSNAK